MRLLYSSSESFAKPVSRNISMPLIFARASRKGKSKKSPLKVPITVGFKSRICEKKREIVAAYEYVIPKKNPIKQLIRTSFDSLKMMNGPSYPSLGVYSKSSMSSLTISRFVIR